MSVILTVLAALIASGACAYHRSSLRTWAIVTIVTTVVACLAESPPELAQDIIYEGIHLVGGGALLRGLANRLADETEVPVHLVATPLECVVQGAGQCLESFDRLKRLFADED